MTNEDTNTEVATEETSSNTAPAVETAVADDGVVEKGSLSLEGAIEAALEIEREKDESTKKTFEKEDSSSKDTSKTFLRKKADKVQTQQEKVEPVKGAPTYRAPGNLNKQEIETFYKAPPEVQQMTLRLHEANQRHSNQLREQAKELHDTRQFQESLAPFVKALGINLPPQVAAQRAIQFWHEWETAKSEQDLKLQAAKTWRAKGIEPPEDWINTPNNNGVQTHLKPLQDELSMIKKEIAQQKQEQANTQRTNTFVQFALAKNEDGSERYPDFYTDSGSDLAKELSILVNPEHPEGQVFIKRVQSRTPNYDETKLYEAAYKFLGGQIQDSSSTKPSSQTNHIQTATRAKASVPGQGAAPNSHNIKKYEKDEDAIAAALRHHGMI
jgi:hypothetical protein